MGDGKEFLSFLALKRFLWRLRDQVSRGKMN